MNVRASTAIRRRDPAASYEALVAAAMRCFHRQGYAATRVEDIVQAAGYTRGAFYFHFTDKQECFWHVIAHRERLRGDWPEAVLTGLDPGAVPLEAVLAHTFAHFAAAEDGMTAWVLVMVDFHQQHRDDPEALQRLGETYRGWHANLVRFVRGLQDGGWVDAERDPELLAGQLFAYVEGSLTHNRLYGLDLDALIDGLVRLLRS